MRLITLFILLISSITYLKAQKNDHSHPKNEPTVRAKWGDFKEGELIKTSPININKTPIYKHISSNDSYKDEFKYVDSLLIESMVYDSDGFMVSGFVVQPKTPGNYPCVIYNRGGNRDHGQLLVSNAVVQMGFIASKGYIVIGSNYRGNSGSEGIEEFGGADVNDVLNLIPALGQIESADTSRIGLFGVSRGGMMSYLALKKDDRFKATAIIGGVSDLIQLRADRPEMATHVFSEIIPDYEINADSTLKIRSVIQWADQLSSTNLLILHGDKDEAVNFQQASELHNRLNELNYPHKIIQYRNDNHGLKKHRREVATEIVNWFDAYLKVDGKCKIEPETIKVD